MHRHNDIYKRISKQRARERESERVSRGNEGVWSCLCCKTKERNVFSSIQIKRNAMLAINENGGDGATLTSICLQFVTER